MNWFIIKLWVSYSLEAEVSNEHQNICYGVIRNQDDFVGLILYVPVNNFSVMSERVFLLSSWVEPVLSRD